MTVSNSPQQLLGKRILAARLRKGWNLSALAANARVSRSTLFQMERGTILSPHAATLHRLAVALEIPISQLHPEAIPTNEPTTNAPPCTGEIDTTHCDRPVHPQIDVIVQRFPHVFSGFIPDDWGELHKSCNSSLPLSDESLLCIAANIAHKRETLRRMSILLESHLAAPTVAIVNCLFELVPTAAPLRTATHQETPLSCEEPAQL